MKIVYFTEGDDKGVTVFDSSVSNSFGAELKSIRISEEQLQEWQKKAENLIFETAKKKIDQEWKLSSPTHIASVSMSSDKQEDFEKKIGEGFGKYAAEKETLYRQAKPQQSFKDKVEEGKLNNKQPELVEQLQKQKEFSQQYISKEQKDKLQQYAWNLISSNVINKQQEISKADIEKAKGSIADGVNKDEIRGVKHQDSIANQPIHIIDYKNYGFQIDPIHDYGYKLKENSQLLKKSTGVKHNQSKLPMSKLFEQFPNAIQASILASSYGANKYKEGEVWDNFKNVSGGSKTYLDALTRHLTEGAYNEDEESKLPHLFLILWNSLSATEMYLKEQKIDIKDFAANYLKNL